MQLENIWFAFILLLKVVGFPAHTFVKVFYRYGWKGDVPSLWELFSLYGNKDAILINPSGGFPVSKIPRMLERFVLETCISDPERIYVLQKKSPKNQ